MTEETVNPKSAYMLVYRRTQPLGEGWALARQLAAPADTQQDQGYTHKNKGSDQGSDKGSEMVAHKGGDGSDDGVDVDVGVMMGLGRKSNQSMRGPLKKLIQEVITLPPIFTLVCPTLPTLVYVNSS